jgi:hypothetical protein
MTRNKKLSQSDKSAEAYRQSQILLKDRAEGFVSYNKLLTSTEQVIKTFPKISSGDLLDFLGYEFFWLRFAGQPLLIFARNSGLDKLKDKGLVEICRFRLPEQWIGSGRAKIGNVRTKEEISPVLISLYLYSVNPADFENLLRSQRAIAAYLATIYLDEPNTEIFYGLAEERFDSIK